MDILICLTLATVISSTWLHAIFGTDNCHAIFDTDICHAILDPWHLTLTLGMLHSIYDLWHQHSIYRPGTWYMSYLTPDPNTGIWYAFMWYRYLDLTSWLLTGHYYPWYLYYMTYSWLSLLQGLGMTIILLPDTWYSWTPVYLNPWNREAPDITPDIILLLTPVIG